MTIFYSLLTVAVSITRRAEAKTRRNDMKRCETMVRFEA
jgi:hypothetical protein